MWLFTLGRVLTRLYLRGVEATRRAASEQAGKDKHAAGEAARKAATGQAGKDKRAAGDATRWAKKRAAAATALEEAAAKQRQSRQEQRELYAQLTATAPRTPFEFRPTFDFNRAASVRAAQLRNCAPRTSRSANGAAQLPPRNSRRTNTPRQLFHAQLVVISLPLLFTPRPCSAASF